MSGAAQYRKTGPRTYTPASGQTVAGHRIVEAVAGGRIQHAGAGSVKHLGVSLGDAIAPEQVVTGPTTGGDGRPVTALYSLPTNVAVADAGIEAKVVYNANANFGDWLICAAGGTVTPAGATPDARTVVGQCREPGGVVVSTNPLGLTKLI
jgi:hypothetical protein